MIRKRKFFVRSAIFLIFFGFLFLAASLSWPGPESGANPLRPAGEVQGGKASYEQYAALIGGIRSPQSILAAFENRPVWVQFAGFFDRSWEKYDKKQLAPMRQWAATELAAAVSSKLTVFYPFSGPDFINPYTLFPHAGTYILAALEPIGEVPDFQAMKDKDFDSFFDGLRQSLHDPLNIDYFISAHMQSDMVGKELKGVLPILLFFMARENVHVHEVDYWSMEPDGTIQQVPVLNRGKPGPAGAIPGVRIVFESADSPNQLQTLYYLRVNLYNLTFQRNVHLIPFLKSFGPLITFMKSASYVMFDPQVSVIREFVLDQSHYVLQEDSGIPFKYFDPSVWMLQFYGTYTKPISMFKYTYQPDLARTYETGRDIKPLPFGIGYHYEVNKANLLLATKKKKVER